MGTPALPKYQSGADLFAGWRDDVCSGKRPVLYPVGIGDLANVQLGPGRIVLLGGSPNAGKTSLACQWVFDALRLTEGIRAVICNVEMDPPKLLDRQLARLSGINLTGIHNRQFADDEREKRDAGIDKLHSLAGRVAFVEPPYSLENIAQTADATEAQLILIDYIQRITPPGAHKEKRMQVETTMGYIRRFAERGKAVIVVAAVGRSKDNKGRNSYASETLSLASFRESSELEYGADDAYILCPDASPADPVTLRHFKSRYGETRDIPLTFHKSIQLFTPFNHSDEKEKNA